MTSSRLRIVLSGMVSADPFQGGATWAVLQYVLGLRRLGHDVVLIEPIELGSLRPARSALAASDNAAYFRSVMAAFGLEGTAALLLAGTSETWGLAYEHLREVARHADLLINISGMLADEALLAPIPRRVYLDLDPAFIQLWHATQGIDMRLDRHTQFVTVGQAIGRPGCPVPTCGRQWISSVPPVVLALWPVAERIAHDALTTVGNWRGYGSIEHEGVHYGQKAHSLRPFFALPQRTGEHFLLALGIHPAERDDLEALTRNGWHLLDPSRVAGTPGKYQMFLQGSLAEFGIAKSGYVASQCGWFSDRSAGYLASGRPVLAQETGFSRFLPTGEGLLAFGTIEDILAAIDALRSRYEHHTRAAREIAEAHFDSDKVLVRLLDAVFSA